MNLVLRGLTWGVTFMVNTGYIFQVDFFLGQLFPSWGVNISYSPLLDYLGLGGDSTTDREYRTSHEQTLTFQSTGTTNLLPSLYYNITSSSLTGGFNTSYIQSLGKLFEINSSNADSNSPITEVYNTIMTE